VIDLRLIKIFDFTIFVNETVFTVASIYRT